MFRFAFLLVFALIVITSPAQAEQGALQVENPFSFATAAGQKNGAVFLTLYNDGETDAQLVSASIASETPSVQRIELHTMDMDGDMMMMREVESITVPAGGHVKLEPSGLHVMLIGLESPLNIDEAFDLNLEFSGGGTLVAPVRIVAPGTIPHVPCPCMEKHGEDCECEDGECKCHEHGTKDAAE